MHKCSYCKREYPINQGLTLVLNNGVIMYLCSSKCRKNWLMKRRKVRWISKGEESKAIVAAHEKSKQDKKVVIQ